MDEKSSRRKNVTEPMFDPQEVVDAIQEARGSVTDAARLLGATRQTVYSYIDKYPDVSAALDAARATYTKTCQELARDNHLTLLWNGNKEATNYELSKLEPKPDGLYLDMSKLTEEEAGTLHRLIQKAKPDGSGAAT
jgi:predicted transcriptional regulator